MAHVEIHVQLAVDIADNPRMRALARFGRDARPCRDLYIQMLCYAKRTLSDGFVPDEQIGILVYPDPPKVGVAQAAKLMDVGLIGKMDGGYLVTGFLGRNPSREDVERASEKVSEGAVWGNHRRWHLSPGQANPDCPHCRPTDSPTDPEGDPPPIGGAIGDRQRGESTETETETETETLGAAEQAPANGRRRTRAPDLMPISPTMTAWAARNNVTVDLVEATAQMLDHHRAKGSLMADWGAAWRTWMTNTKRFGGPAPAAAPDAWRYE
jgi:hypothetical protein